MSQSAAQAAAFYTEVVAHGLVWTVRDGVGYPAPQNKDGRRAQPFWSTRARAERIVDNVPAYSGLNVESIELAAWRDHWLPGLERDGLLVGLNWTGTRAAGFDVEPTSVIERLATALRTPLA